MPEPILSLKTRNEFREYFVATSLRIISEAFDGAGVRCDSAYLPSTGGQRRTLVEQYYHSVDWFSWNSVKRVVKVFENELRELYAPRTGGAWGGPASASDNRGDIAGKLLYWLRQDGFEWRAGRLIRHADRAVLEDLTGAAQMIEGAHLALQIQRMKDSVETDPALAIGTAKELVETVCKTILEERGKPPAAGADIPTLTKSVCRELKLVPEGIHDASKGADLIKGVLRSLGTIGNDLAQLRGLYGTGHGKAAQAKGLQPRHAKLAVGAAATLVVFLVETHRERAD